MTSPKKPNSRRTVFDASFSEFLLNLNTSDKMLTGDIYLSVRLSISVNKL